ncbi:DUF2066 domain-containing protein [Stenotrophomonas sp. ATCM1_4]|uniref:DUF2066 domain-containing protein n=1 Tax=Stenotrophomonas sp. ATCM1_4 TaxID=2259330 RepID=UPI001FB5AB3F|nr:DUF2066 domain-containing protein [Stenotrophomonas sp. ATCM1_4]
MEYSMRRSLVTILFLALCLPLGGGALAQSGMRTEGDVANASGTYEAEVPVNSQSDADRGGALARALGAVLGKLSGDRAAMTRPGVAQALRSAKDMVESYDYRQDQSIGTSGAPSYRTMLVARFRQDDVDGLVAALGLPVWPQPRPKPVIWLAIDDGSGPRLVGTQQANAARPLLDRAIERGYRLGLPAGGAAEQALVGAIWRQDTTAVARASARYAPPMQLVGKLYRAGGGGWQADWVFVDNGRELSKWTTRDGDARRAMAGGADGAADALVRRYAKAPVAGAAGTYRIAINGIRGADDYLRAASALQGAAVVKSIIPVQANGDRLELDVELMTGLPGLNRMLGQNSPLQPVGQAVQDGDATEVTDTGSKQGEYRIR